MPLPATLLQPIPGSNPAGANLRYAEIYDKIKEARREDEDLPAGVWQRALKSSDHRRVVKLATEALEKQSKDLQIAAWLTEALVRTEGFAGLAAGLGLIAALLENFWDSLFPELEDGDAELRATPLDWLNLNLDAALRRAPLTEAGYGWYQYQEARAVGYEKQAEESDERQRARAVALEEGKLDADAFDASLFATPLAFYTSAVADLAAGVEGLDRLDGLCAAKFGEQAPSFRRVRATLQELQQVVGGLATRREAHEPRPSQAIAAAEPEPAWTAAPEAGPPRFADAPAEPDPGAGMRLEPRDREEAVDWILAAARQLRQANPEDPVPYLLVRGLRWGELRAAAEPEAVAEPPATELRRELKRLAVEERWDELLAAAEAAAAQACGRAWLDPHRYADLACAGLGEAYARVAAALRSAVRALLGDFPALPQQRLLDDTAAASPETQRWLDAIAAPAPMATPAAAPAPAPVAAAMARGAEPDAWEQARQWAAEGRMPDAIQLMLAQAAREPSGRGRFERRLQLAQLCMGARQDKIAYPILAELAAEIAQRKLEEWEPPATVARALVLYHRCLEKTNRDGDELRRVYMRICQIDATQALELGK